MKGKQEPVHVRFWRNVQKTPTCWLWTGAYQKPGYGKIGDGSHSKYAHRVSWELQAGAIPHGLQVLHRCDNPQCVRPDHLFLGTQADNVADMYAKGRDGMKPRTVCQRGLHAMTGSNVGRAGRSRVCLACRRARRRADKERTGRWV
jgi:hypothetical protein